MSCFMIWFKCVFIYFEVMFWVSKDVFVFFFFIFGRCMFVSRWDGGNCIFFLRVFGRV